MKGKTIKEEVNKYLELPEELFLNLSKVTIVGKKEVSIENYKGIIEYENEVIRVNTSDGIIKISGKNLEIISIITEEILIGGNICGVEFVL